MSTAHIQALLQDRSEAPDAEPGHSGAASPLGRRYIVALIQNRAKEVGLAAVDLQNGTNLWIAQYVDSSRSFATTL